MKIAVVNNCVPFLKGGAEHLAQALEKKLLEYGHEAILVRIPFQWRPPGKILESILACRLMRFHNIDRIVALKFPAYQINHPDKIVWLLHQFRQAYDLWGTAYQDIPNTDEGQRIREVIIRSDNESLSRVTRIYTNSHVTSERLWKFNQLSSEILYPPLLEANHLVHRESEDYLFMPGRITLAKRQHLAVEAMAYVNSRVRLIIAGQPETLHDEEILKERIERLGVGDRVTLIPRFITEQEKARLFGSALGCVYIPYDEDSYGYVALEACHCRKPVITCADSGGTSLLVKDQVTGLVCAPDAKEISAAMDRLHGEQALAREMGEAGHAHMLSLGITWDRVIECLTSRA